MQYTVLIPGGFKPLHKGHYEYIKFYLDNPDVLEVKLYVGDKEREGISIEHTEALLEAYGLLSHPRLNYRRASIREGKKGPYTNPLADCYDYAETRVLEPVALGSTTKDAGYREGFKKYFKGIRDNIIDAPIFNMQCDISATQFRAALRNGESIVDFLPDGVSEVQIRELFKTQSFI